MISTNQYAGIDNSRFGHKIMSKLGWIDGAGLGVSLNGSVEHIKVAEKRDMKGKSLICVCVFLMKYN